MQHNKFFRIYNLFILALAFLQLLMNLKLVAFNGEEADIIQESFFKCISFIVFSFLFYLIVKEDLKYLKLIVFIHLGICLFAILQHPLSPLSSQIHDIKLALYSGIENDESLLKKLTNQELYIDLGIGSRFRLSGPFAGSITFSYFLMSTFFLNLYLYFRSQSKFFLFSIAFIILCSILTQTRSLVLAQATMLMGLFLFIHNVRLNSYKVIFTIIGLVLSLFYIDRIEAALTAPDASRLTNLSDEGSDRPLLWYTGAYAVFNHPFGITDDQYDKVRQKMYEKTGSGAVLYMPSHNGFINTGFNYTIFGYFVLIAFFIFLIRYTNRLSKDYRYLFYLFFIGYSIHSCFHNNYIFYSDYDIYMVLMLLPLQLYWEQTINYAFSNPITNEQPN